MLDDHDHRSLGQRQDLFHLQEDAPGMVFWHPRGHVVYRAIEDAVRRRIARDGYHEVRTPQLLRRPIWQASGHWAHFAHGMFLLADDALPAALKPVSCPGLLQIAARMAPSYRDLPLRLAEFGVVHRNEPGGTLHGLFRLRQFTQDDGHILCEPGDVVSEVVRFCEALAAFYRAFGFEHLEAAFASRPAERAGSDADWDRAEALLADAARAAGLACELHPGDGAFYGPKLEFALRDRLGRAWQCGTIQLDPVLPERFGVAYVDAHGARRTPVMLHRAILGSLERFLGVLLEHHRGALPAWLAPEQVALATVSDAQRGYADRVRALLIERGLRVVAGGAGETLSRRIAEAHAAGVPFVLVVGAREAASERVALRARDGSQRALPLADVAAELQRLCAPPA
jgi:threonyl-tRNA synthetase